MTTNKQENRSSFSKLLGENKVIVPIIQRDYAQGRLDDHSKMVRKNFLQAIRLAIETNEHLDLNFIYGKTISNNNVNPKQNFYPVDGQQRLTTLFLVHWYLMKKHSKKTIGILKNFSYEARLTSKDFFKSFIKNSSKITLPTIDLNRGKNQHLLSDEIKNSAWFDETWQFDPTVQGALTMLDDIQIEFKDITDEQIDRLFDKNECPITFILECLDCLGEPDALYIKLNSRGRPLTYLELFKAKVFDIISNLNKNNTIQKTDEEIELCKNFKSNFDNEWTTLVWKFKKDRPKQFDSTFLNIFWIIYNNYLIENERCSMNNNNLDKDKLKETANYNLWLDDFNMYSEENAESRKRMLEYLLICYKFLNSIDKFENEYQKIIFRIIGDEDKKISYDDMATIFALTKYILKYPTIDNQNFKKFYRVFSNLLKNSVGSEKIDSVKDLENAFESINNKLIKLIENADDILNNLKSMDEQKLPGFSEYQWREEINKANIIVNNSEFEKAILDAEDFSYFDGQIGSALYISKTNGAYDVGEFKKYWARIKKLFNDYESKNSEIKRLHLIRRALLCFGDYRLDVSERKTLCPDDKSESHKTPSLKRAFREKPDIVKPLLDKIDEDESKSIKEQLENIIDDKKDSFGIDNWQYLFIEEPKMFDDSKELRMCENNNKIYLLKNVNSTLNTNQDIYLKYLYIKLSAEYNDDITFNSGKSECELKFKNICQILHEGDKIILNQNGQKTEVSLSKEIAQKISQLLKKCHN